MKRIILALTGSAFLAVGLLSSAHANPVTYINAGDTNTLIPGGTGTFTDVDLPAVSGGFVVYGGQGSDGQDGIYRFDLFGSGGLEVVADTNTPEAGGTGTFVAFSSYSFHGGAVE